MIFELLMTAILAYQVMMPQVNNAKYTFAVLPDGAIIRMNSQDGSMERCDSDLRCGDRANVPVKELDYKY